MPENCCSACLSWGVGMSHTALVFSGSGLTPSAVSGWRTYWTELTLNLHVNGTNFVQYLLQAIVVFLMRPAPDENIVNYNFTRQSSKQLLNWSLKHLTACWDSIWHPQESVTAKRGHKCGSFGWSFIKGHLPEATFSVQNGKHLGTRHICNNLFNCF